MSSPGAVKLLLRSRLRAELKVHSLASSGPASADLCELMRNSSTWQSARAVLLFFPLASEPDIAPLLAAALADGKLLALPRFNAATQHYEAVQIRDLTRELVIGHFEVREPVAACPVVPLNRLDLALVPGLGFDLSGRRLGRGKGYYDRLLAGFIGRKIGVAFDFQIVAEVPCEAHDIVLNDIVTPARWIEAKAH